MTQQDQGSGTNADGDRPEAGDTGFGGEQTTGRASDGGWDRDATDEDAVEEDRLDEGEGDVPWSAAADAATAEGADSWAASADAEPAPGSGRG